MQKLTIKNFGPIDYIELDVNKFNLLIGEQAVGKSTIAKCIYFFRAMKDVLVDSLIDDVEKFHTNTELRMLGFFDKLFGSSAIFTNEPSIMTYNFSKDVYARLTIDKDSTAFHLVLNEHDFSKYDYTNATLLSDTRARIKGEITK